MSRRFVFILIGLVLISGVSRHEGGGVLAHALALPAALVLYPLVLLAVLSILAAPLVYALGLWLLWYWTRNGRLPGWVGRPVRWLRARRPWGYRLRLERQDRAEHPARASDTPGTPGAAPDAEAIHTGA